MNKSVITLNLIVILTLVGCSNIKMVQTRPGCQRGVGIFAWDVCEDTSNPVPTPRLKIKGDKELQTETFNDITVESE